MVMNREEVDSLASRLGGFHEAGRSTEELAKLLSEEEGKPVSKSTIRGWIRTGKGPRKNAHQYALKRVVERLESEKKGEKRVPNLFPLQSNRFGRPLGVINPRIVADQIRLLIPHLRELIASEDVGIREDLESELGKDAQWLFINLVRCLLSERIREQMIQEDSRIIGD